jgi:hypothetical protein
MQTFIILAILLQNPLGAAGQAAKDAIPSQSQVSSAMAQPAKDIGLIRPVAPELVRNAAAAPYDVKGMDACEPLSAAIAALDTVLGPDVDLPAQPDKGGLLSGALRGALGLPYGGMVRWVSGAEQREKAYQRAVMAAEARRAFLKGRASAMKCVLPPPPRPAPLAAPAAAATAPATAIVPVGATTGPAAHGPSR